MRFQDGFAAVDAQISFATTANRDGGWKKTGNGTVELAGAGAAYLGPTLIEGGTVRWITTTAMPNTPLTVTAGTLDLNGNPFTESRALTMGGGASGTSSTIASGAGIFTLGTNLLYNGNVANDSGATISGNLALSATRTFTVNNSTAAVNDLTVSALVSGTGFGITKVGTGTMLLSSNSNSYTGPTTVSAGTLLVNGATAASSVFTVGANGTLGGIGTIGGPVTVDGTLAPGASIESLDTGTVTFNNASILAAEINTSTVTSDLLDIAGNLNLIGAPVLNLTDLGSNQVIGDGLKLTLIEYTGTWNSGVFSGLADDSTFSFGANTFEIDYNDGNAVTLTSLVPEPSSLGLIGLAGLAMLRRRRAM
jgi:autotransporter-associated beta strand protein